MTQNKATTTLSANARERYNKLETERKPYTDRAEKCAKYTIPMLFPKDTDNSSTNYETPFQSMGARGINNLSSKLLLALFPPNEPFFRLSLGSDIVNAIGEDSKTKVEWDAALVKIEQTITSYMETHQIRTTANEAILQLIVAGNALLFLPPAEGGMRMYRLNSYVVQRDGVGNILEIVTKEKIAYGALPEQAQSCLGDNQDIDPDKIYEIYSHVILQGDNYVSYQEIEGTMIAGSNQSYPKDKSPWIPIRLRKMDGEAYGRSFVDEYIGDLKALEGLSKSLVQLAAVAGNIIYLVNPNSTTRVSELSKANSGDFIKGKIDDVQALQINKTQDMQVANAMKQDIESRLSYAFLLNSAVQRDAERVTAEEIRYVANELEDTIGGIYSILSQELQLPLVKRFMVQMERLGAIPELPQGSKGVDPQITTGIEALGRGHDLTKLDSFLKYAQVLPEAFQQRLKQGEIMTQLATAIGIDASSVIKTDEEVAQEQQQAQENQLAQSTVPQIAGAAMKQQ
ncbi:portal protein [Pectinatus frisingensis]|uniref:portal protein n=1 Tax=Pectinatus frisingensis TaxID=865 RepID=UPI0018C4FD3E|nr:portal protein [Pectinatus frisingensis]